MRLRMLVVASLVASALYACDGGGSNGNGSGIDGNKTLMSLSSSEWMTLCTYVASVQGGGGHVTECGGGLTVTSSTVAECVSDSSAFASCTATVANAEACGEAVGADPCGDPGTACDAILACVTQ